ncbi:hypothetical protein MANES_08G041200v8 [Manihot esculenta]|uniref:Knottin scorpion toxin-like domain-containing protein n=1 Tax=Manihot esculenta TaxID=3983 RepID=A0A2C9VDF8_MANES|nr:hypothetical protein MANES_08G041200v8 [Manihot esculenta]
MKLFFYVLLSLLLLLISAEFTQSVAVQRAHAVRIPEHTCHKKIDIKTCDFQKCNKECAKETLGVGDCRNALCFCTYYCKQPPI